MIHNGHVENLKTSQVSSDKFWSFVQKKQKHGHMNKLTEGDCGIGITQASSSLLNLSEASK
ncbi:MAG: hypothetical protein MK289_06730 [Trichodesmium sp. ALOHA_ZT_67]|nr:hypothetical protein [Trichodesmium sp. ALOHA_ZT_67]